MDSAYPSQVTTRGYHPVEWTCPPDLPEMNHIVPMTLISLTRYTYRHQVQCLCTSRYYFNYGDESRDARPERTFRAGAPVTQDRPASSSRDTWVSKLGDVAKISAVEAFQSCCPPPHIGPPCFSGGACVGMISRSRHADHSSRLFRTLIGAVPHIAG